MYTNKKIWVGVTTLTKKLYNKLFKIKKGIKHEKLLGKIKSTIF